ncbi:uncharacterized protein BO88DRAFT_405349 [Aspergillus vadensis CBS 113365]|uniref:Uncharacterized protein n=1 Tax=Aspergillus vadensis (strain CBS 113365 / IMI 142717 / IBT 24658) TaxID=1448311 RepID=A0A319CJF2_ASPVC|nr:hypothetical protein BO88DRAFT_405349 [Aspergillus vadensis CBS 113365]PYH68422.1 hypothetical protein BO88DRAFT_405349 [Aspergillus vadensis CBS 113365]
MSIMPEERKSLLLATAKRPNSPHVCVVYHSLQYLRTGYHQQQGVHLLADAPVLEQNSIINSSQLPHSQNSG